MRILILCLLLFGTENVFANSVINIGSIMGSQTCSMSEKEILQAEKQQVEIARQNFKPYKCNNFNIGDKVTHSFYYPAWEKTDFVGVVTKIEPKPTTEYIHWITVKRLSGSGTSVVYSEQFLTRVN